MRGTKLTVVQQVIEYIKQNIENGTWPVGDKIPSEHDLTELLEVSRASVRVAIQQFIAVGVLDSVHGKGTFVRKNDLGAFGKKDNQITKADCEDMRKVLEFRKMIEPEGAYLAATLAEKASVDRLRKYLDQMKQSIGDFQKFMEADSSFHEEIAASAQNHLLFKTLKQVFGETRTDHNHLVEVFGYKDGIYYHTVLLKAITDKDAKTAKKTDVRTSAASYRPVGLAPPLP